MIHRALGRPVPIELSDDERIRARVGRLAVVSLVALGLIAGVALATTETPPAILAGLVAGWTLMPAVLAWSLREPAARYVLVLPASLVSLGLLAIAIRWLPDPGLPAAGWVLMAAGVCLGAVLGLWFWFRLAPVPAGLDDPLSPARWAFIAIHVALVVAGAALAATALPG